MPAQDQPQGLTLLVGEGVEGGGHAERFRERGKGGPPRIFWIVRGLGGREDQNPERGGGQGLGAPDRIRTCDLCLRSAEFPGNARQAETPKQLKYRYFLSLLVSDNPCMYSIRIPYETE